MLYTNDQNNIFKSQRLECIYVTCCHLLHQGIVFPEAICSNAAYCMILLSDLCQVRPSDHMMKIEQVLCFYQDLTPTLLLDYPLGLVKLLEGVGSQNEAFDLTENEAEREAMSRTVTESELLPQLYLLKLLSGTDARRLPWGKEVSKYHIYSNIGTDRSEQTV